MKIVCDHVETSCRPLLMFLAEHRLDVTIVERRRPGPPCPAPESAGAAATHGPRLETGALIVSGLPAILKHLADLSGSPAYPSNPKSGAAVDARMDWLAEHLGADLGAGHPGSTNLERSLNELDYAMRRTRQPFLCGSAISIADHLATGPLALADAAGFDFSSWQKLDRWLRQMKARGSWKLAHGALYG